ncbi:histidinol dehydrogenase [Subsaxibacter sp. CAU 1640]|uniref:histidinol dehydrogenase n=1 Tax=Subsaxibacter sp. CAU 1640 TaxID=2933271 RepID=UPI0020052580|nr:histidinol dehydrogenase [Subsaxibacter sp. CAU 1640]MCK7591007.1 histidinol dehydrogenase [Subsaxibacter sp. CAU 1640]
MKIIENPKKEEWSQLLMRPTTTIDAIESTVNEIFADVQRNGDRAIAKYTSMFDGVESLSMKVSAEDISNASSKISQVLKMSIKVAKGNIEKFHDAQRTDRVEVETMPGVLCWQEKKAIEKIGLYIPGGTAPLFSTVLMLAVPAKLAGCKDIILCTPPDKNGNIANEILYTTQLCGVTEIYKVGGIQAIAGLTFGTESIPKVYKIFGPGNQFVTVAKQMATKYGVAIDMPAGPSELLVFADDSGNPSYVASDLLSQAEHGSDSQVILVTTSKTMLSQVQNQLEFQMDNLPRKSIIQKSIEHSKLIYIENEEIALELINEYAPEHLIICSKNEEFFTNSIVNAGSVFLGNFTPESAGDYASGTNHTLPTNGFSRAYSGVNLDSFQKSITYQKITREGLKTIGETIENMAAAEGLQAHKNAVSIRLKDI